MRRIRISLMVLAGLFFLSVTSQLFSQEDVIKERRALMKGNSKASKPIKKAAKDKDYATIEAKAKAIAAAMDKVLDLFPKGSTAENSRAKPEIWEKWDEFSKAPPMLKAAAQALADAAMTKDEQLVGEKLKAFGKACGTCHKPFRKPKKKKKT